MPPEQLDSALLPERFLALFPQRFGSTFRATGGTAWRAMSQFHYLEDDSILASLGGSSKNLRACLLDKKTNFLTLSCPTSDEELELAKVAIEQLRSVGLKPNLYKESGSEAVQIFLAFSEPVDTDFAATAIGSFLKTKSLVVHNTKSPFVLPLQQGFAWLNNNFSVKVECDQIAIEAAIAMFLHDLNSNSVSPDVLATLAHTEETSCSTEPFDFDQSDLEETLIECVEADRAIDIQESPTKNLPPAEMPGAANQVPVPGGQQLLLFPVEPRVVQLELPKERPKRKKRARSDLPADTQSEALVPTLFTSLPTDAQGVLQPLKEAYDD
jgi:hypothetical protein